MEAPMPILVCLRPRFTAVICGLMCHEENAGLYSLTLACTIRHRYFEPNASVYDQGRRLEPNASVWGPIPSFRAKRRRVPPNATSPTVLKEERLRFPTPPLFTSLIMYIASFPVRKVLYKFFT